MRKNIETYLEKVNRYLGLQKGRYLSSLKEALLINRSNVRPLYPVKCPKEGKRELFQERIQEGIPESILESKCIQTRSRKESLEALKTLLTGTAN